MTMRCSATSWSAHHRATSKVYALRVLSETGVHSPAYRTLKRRLPVFAKPGFRHTFANMPGWVLLGAYDVSTLHPRRRSLAKAADELRT